MTFKDKLLDKLLSRKLWVLIITMGILILNKNQSIMSMGNSNLMVRNVAYYLLGQSGVDIAKMLK